MYKHLTVQNYILSYQYKIKPKENRTPSHKDWEYLNFVEI